MTAISGLRPGKDGKLPMLAEKKESPKMEADHASAGGDHSELHDHGDGSFHTVHGGDQAEHPSLGHALMHLAGKHSPEGKHMHIQQDDMGTSSHHVSDGGEPEGPHDHENIEALKSHMDKFLSEEAAEKGGYDEEGNEGEGLKGFGG